MPRLALPAVEFIIIMRMPAAGRKAVAVTCSIIVIMVIAYIIFAYNRFDSCYDSATQTVHHADKRYLYLSHPDGVYAYPNEGPRRKVPPCPSNSR